MIAIDTGVWIEYINTRGVLHHQAKAVVDSVIQGKVTADLYKYSLFSTLTEVFVCLHKGYHPEVHTGHVPSDKVRCKETL